MCAFLSYDTRQVNGGKKQGRMLGPEKRPLVMGTAQKFLSKLCPGAVAMVGDF
jgi:hypothetical protein